jgi:tripartite-type tricarboxylate transporter receptor subunit TctC
VVTYGFAVGPMVPESVRSVKDFFDWAKANPAKASFATPGAGGPHDFSMKLLSKEIGVELNHVPYRGSAPGVQDLVGGQVASMYSPVGDSLPHRASGRMRLLATSGARRSRFATDVATFTEQGFAFMEMSEWYGLWMPKGASEAVVTRAHAAIKAAIAQPETLDILAKLAVEGDASTPQEFGRIVREANAAWPERVRKTGFKPDA